MSICSYTICDIKFVVIFVRRRLPEFAVRCKCRACFRNLRLATFAERDSPRRRGKGGMFSIRTVPTVNYDRRRDGFLYSGGTGGREDQSSSFDGGKRDSSLLGDANWSREALRPGAKPFFPMEREEIVHCLLSSFRVS